MGFSTLSRWLRNAAGWSQEVAMYSRFTDRSRKVMQLANQEAQRFNHEYIGTEHILLGLIEEGNGVAANVLKNLNVDLKKVRPEVVRIIQRGPDADQVIMGRLPFPPRSKKVIEYAIEEARALHHNYVGTEHILLGLLREQEGVAAQVLMNLGVKFEEVRKEVLSLMSPSAPVGEVSPQLADVARRLKDLVNEALTCLKELKEKSHPGDCAPPIVIQSPGAVPLPQLEGSDPTGVLADHIGWLNAVKELAVAKHDFECAAELRAQIEKLQALRKKLSGES
jgi:hypothetical protein